MKKQAVGILAHNRPEQVNALIDYFPADKFDLYIHIDRKSDILPQIVQRDNVFFVPRVSVYWGQYSQVEATLSLLKSLKKDAYSWFHLISGVDAPAMDVDSFLSRMEGESGEFLECFPTGPGSHCHWKREGEDRYAVWYPQFLIRRPTDKLFDFVRGAYKVFVMKTKLFKRKNMPVKKIYGGSNWFTVSQGFVDWILAYLDSHPEYEKFFRHTMNSDELFFSTLAAISPFQIRNENLRYIRWDPQLGTGGPASLEENDVDEARASNALFARKVESMDILKGFISKLTGKDSEDRRQSLEGLHKLE